MLSADGRTVTLDQPLEYQHGGIYGYAEAVPVGNLTRNVVVESENSKDVSRRGHVMFMHTQDVVIDSALFRELGRTNVEGALTSPEVKDGKLVAGTDANTHRPLRRAFPHPLGGDLQAAAVHRAQQRRGGQSRSWASSITAAMGWSTTTSRSASAARTSSRRTAARSAASRATWPSAPTARIRHRRRRWLAYPRQQRLLNIRSTSGMAGMGFGCRAAALM